MPWDALHLDSEDMGRYLVRHLNQSGVMAAQHSLSLAGASFSCIVWPSEDRAKALKALELGEPIPSTCTDDGNFRLLMTKPVLSLLPVGQNSQVVEAIVRTFTKEWDVRAVLTHSWGASVKAMSAPGILRLHSYSLPATQVAGGQQPVQATQPNVLFGLAMPAGMNLLAPTGLGIPVKTPQEGIVIAELCDSVLYLLLDLVYAPANRDLVLTLIHHLCALVNDIFHPAQHPKQNADTREIYVQACTHRTRMYHALLETRRALVDEEIALTSKLLAEKYREKDEIQAKLESLRQRGHQLQEEFDQEYETLLRAPHVRNIEIDGHALKVHTDEIYLQWDGKTYLMGRYTIKIPLEGGNVTIWNDNFRRQGGTIVHHPHSTGAEGGVCFGEIGESLGKLLASREYAMAALMVIDFLHQFKPLDHYIGYLRSFDPLPRARSCTCARRKGKE